LLGFETLTFAPIDQRLIVTEMLSEAEAAWLDDYHRQVLDRIGPQLEGEDSTWLETQCAPLAR
jgi:Xaa-Pro aminopeptidase